MNNIVNWEILNKIVNGCGGLIYNIFNTKNSKLKNVEIAMCIFSPSEIARLHYHKKMEEIYFILEGEGEIELDKKWHKVKTEDCIAIPAGIKHRMKNTNKSNNLKFLSVNSPEWQETDMILLKN